MFQEKSLTPPYGESLDSFGLLPIHWEICVDFESVGVTKNSGHPSIGVKASVAFFLSDICASFADL